MLKFLLKRFVQMILVLICVSVFAFLLIHIAPGNPARMMLPDGASAEDIYAMEVKLGLDKPLYEQYFMYIGNVLKGDLGTSTQYKMPVITVIAQRLPNTLKLSFWALIVGCIICIPLGIIAGSHKGSFIDFFAMLFALIGQAMSTVWLAVLLIYVFSVKLKLLPTMGMDTPLHYILPVFTLACPLAAETTRIGRSGMIDTLSEDYITATYAKGISSIMVNWKYAFRCALCPIVTLVGMRLCAFLAGAVVVESVFSWPGIGQLLVGAVSHRDYAMVQSLLLINAAMFAVINLVVDIINSLIDPRIVLE